MAASGDGSGDDWAEFSTVDVLFEVLGLKTLTSVNVPADLMEESGRN